MALHLANAIQGEIVSADSMQVYRDLDVGTAKPSLSERKLVPHHLVDVVEMTDSFDAAAWVWRAHEAVAAINARGRQPILCGGTGLYFKAFFEGLGAGPPGDPGMRRQLEETALEDLLLELKRKDPVMFEQIDRKNSRRVVRAVEIVRLSGRTCSEQRVPWRKSGSFERERRDDQPQVLAFVGIEREKPDLRQRIDERVEEMFALGLVEETRRLLERGLARNRTAMQAIGYRQVVEFLRGQRSLEETMTEVKKRTWQLARRQMNWFRHQADVDWVMVKPKENLAEVAERLVRRLKPGLRMASAAQNGMIGKET